MGNNRGRTIDVISPSPQPSPSEGEGAGSALAVRAPAGGLFGGGAVVVDDAPLWLAWETAQAAWLESKRRKSGGENTVRAYSAAVRSFFEWAQVAPWQVSSMHAQGWVRWMASPERTVTSAGGEVVRPAGALAPATVNQRLAALSSFYDFVQRRYSVHRDGREISLWPADRANPFIMVERSKISPYGKAKFPSTDELQAILGAINTATVSGKRDFALLYTIAQMCRRSSEVTNIRWGDIERLSDGNYQVRFRYKGGDLRKAKMNRLAFQAIVAYLAADGRPPEQLTPESYVFVPLDPERIRRVNALASADPNRPISNHTANGILKKWARRAGVPAERAHIHGLRHAGARLRVENDRRMGQRPDLEDLMHVLGHSSLAVTQIYSETLLEEPEDRGGEAAATALVPKGKERRRRRPAGEQRQLL